MATDVTIVLQGLSCVRESEGGSEPYIWPILLRIDDTTLSRQPPKPVDVTGPSLGAARVVLKSDMRAGETAAIPFPLGSLGVSFEDGLTVRTLLLVIALLEKDETPEAAMWAGCKAFSGELEAAITEKLPQIYSAVQQDREGNHQPLNQLIEYIKERVKARVVSVTWDALTWWQKTRVATGVLDLDDFIGADFKLFSESELPYGPTHVTFTLPLKTDDSSDEYTLDGTLDGHRRKVDVCQSQVDSVAAAQAVVDGIEGQINLLKTELQHATPQQKPSIIAQIQRLNQDLPAAMAALEEARQALQDCRTRWIRKISEVAI